MICDRLLGCRASSRRPPCDSGRSSRRGSAGSFRFERRRRSDDSPAPGRARPDRARGGSSASMPSGAGNRPLPSVERLVVIAGVDCRPGKNRQAAAAAHVGFERFHRAAVESRHVEQVDGRVGVERFERGVAEERGRLDLGANARVRSFQRPERGFQKIGVAAALPCRRSRAPARRRESRSRTSGGCRPRPDLPAASLRPRACPAAENRPARGA